MRTLKSLTLVMSLLAAGPALAGGYVTLKCPDGSFSHEFMVGSGRQIKGQGLELWPMLCTDTGRFAIYPRIMNAARFAKLEALAARSVKDTVEVQTILDLSAELGDETLADLFDRVEGLTFGDIRSTVGNIARDSGQRLGQTHHTYHTHPTCTGGLVPFDFYLDSGAPCQACGGAPLEVDTTNRTEWE
ncbi:MAG: hypothetical protein HY985_02230 [Magnetospirillum sp.]|nr:hypothetical protein [Magnetospirillum sp.]